MNPKIKFGIINYQMGNLASLQNAFAHLHSPACILHHAEQIKHCDAIILPGVGAFGEAMRAIKQQSFHEAIFDFVQSGKRLLGICLGMQLLFEMSYEFGEHAGLGLLKGRVEPFDKEQLSPQKVPHVGWNEITTTPNPLFAGLPSAFYLYFVHSFHIKSLSYAIGVSFYGHEFASIVCHNNIYGIQPHPEKSHNAGLQLLKNFVHLKD